MTAPALVQKLWNYCNILRDDGLSYGDSIKVRAARAFSVLLLDSRFHRSGFAQTSGLPLSASLRLKIADEQGRPPYNKPSPIPKGFGWDKFSVSSFGALS
jgi:type I restriction enzyme M protein